MVNLLSKSFLWQHKFFLWLTVGTSAYCAAMDKWFFFPIMALNIIAIEILYATLSLGSDEGDE